MNRSSKKCFLASSGAHLLILGLIVLFSSAFQPSQNKSLDLPLIDFTPVITTDDKVSGGGNPHGRHAPAPLPALPPAPTPAAPLPRPQVLPPPKPEPLPDRHVEPPKQREPDPSPKEAAKEPDQDSKMESLTPQPVRKPKKAKIELANVPESKPSADDKLKERAAERKKLREKERLERLERDREEQKAWEQQQEDLAARRNALNDALRSARNIGGQLGASSTISIDDMLGPGGGGVPYANFLVAVKSIYEREWVVPDGVTGRAATTMAEVTIGRDGTVLSWRIVRSSGIAAVDQTVKWTLNRVKFAAPLPPGVPEDQRVVPINFTAKPKSQSG